MYLESYVGGVNPSIGELNFAGLGRPTLSNDALGVLVSINRHSPVDIGADNTQLRFRLKSGDFSDRELFDGLRKDWALIVGWRIIGFALIFRVLGPDQGVWLHQLTPGQTQSEILHGCHERQS